MNIKQFLTIGIVASTLLGLPAFALALNVKDLPNPRHQGEWVADTANLLSPSTKAQLNRLLSKLEVKTGDELAVVTVSHVNSNESPAFFATELFNYWGIGKKGKNNGVLVFIDQGDRRVEIKTGYGVGSILPDATLNKIITQQMTPQFKQGDFDSGTLAGTQTVVEVLESSSAPTTLWHSSTSAAAAKENAKNAQLELGFIAFITIVGTVIKIVGDKIHEVRSCIRVSPTGSSRNAYEEDDSLAYCAQCDRPMKLLNAKTLYRLLSKPLQIAVQLKSVQVIGWHCPNCQPIIAGIKNIQLCIYDMDIKQFHFCPHCDERTVVHTEVSVQPSRQVEGRIDIHDTCQCCDYDYQAEETILLRRQSGNRSEVQRTDSFNYDYTTGLYAAGAGYLVAREVTDSSSSSSDSSNSSSDSSNSWSDSSSGGTDFGGGISGGDGAGGSW